MESDVKVSLHNCRTSKIKWMDEWSAAVLKNSDGPSPLMVLKANEKILNCATNGFGSQCREERLEVMWSGSELSIRR